MPESRLSELPSILKSILSDKTARLEEQKRRSPQSEIKRLCRDLQPPRDFRAAIQPSADPGQRGGAGTPYPPAIIAEFKRRSPSRGVIRPNADLAAVHAAYLRGGADACSVLTEEDHFGGSLADLKALRDLSAVPLLRKDFLFDPYQVYESRANGADALLLIVAALDDRPLAELIELSRELKMDALVEVHCQEELKRALACGSRVVGINNRDLRSFAVDLDVSLTLAPEIPHNITVVSESGIRGPEDIRRLKTAGIGAFLVGEHLMRSADPAAALSRLKEAL